MKKYTLIPGFMLALCFTLVAQGDTVTRSEILEFAFEFNLEDGKFTGQGADSLLKAIDEAQYVLLGNHHRSYQEEVLALAMAKHLHSKGCRNIVMEIGPASSEILTQNLTCGKGGPTTLKNLNTEFGLINGVNLYAPIPDLKSTIAADALDFLYQQNWSIHGIGYESWTAYKMIIRHLFEKLPDAKQRVHHSKYEKVMLHLDSLYASVRSQNNDDLRRFSHELKDSESFEELLNILESHDDNAASMKALRFSIDYWQMYGERKFYKKNKFNAKRNKLLLHQIFEKPGLQQEKDKLFIRMWRQHMTKGLTSNGFYGIGNTLNELAELRGNSAVNIAIVQRHFVKDGVTQEGPMPDDFYAQLFKDFAPLGKQDKYVLVDLTKFNKAFYWNGYHIPKSIDDVYKRYDYLIISKTDKTPDINY